MMTHHLCRGCVPGEVVHSRGGQVVLIVLRELLELVLVVWEASIHAEVPADGRATMWSWSALADVALTAKQRGQAEPPLLISDR